MTFNFDGLIAFPILERALGEKLHGNAYTRCTYPIHPTAHRHIYDTTMERNGHSRPVPVQKKDPPACAKEKSFAINLM